MLTVRQAVVGMLGSSTSESHTAASGNGMWLRTARVSRDSVPVKVVSSVFIAFG